MGEEGGGAAGALQRLGGRQVRGSGQSQGERPGGRGGGAAEGSGPSPGIAFSVCPVAFFPHYSSSPSQHSFPLLLTRCLCLPLQALLREKQKGEELEKTKEATRQFIQDAAVRTRKEVSSSAFFSCTELKGGSRL